MFLFVLLFYLFVHCSVAFRLVLFMFHFSRSFVLSLLVCFPRCLCCCWILFANFFSTDAYFILLECVCVFLSFSSFYFSHSSYYSLGMFSVVNVAHCKTGIGISISNETICGSIAVAYWLVSFKQNLSEPLQTLRWKRRKKELLKVRYFRTTLLLPISQLDGICHFTNRAIQSLRICLSCTTHTRVADTLPI